MFFFIFGLNMLQVRQQSKDFSDKLRETIQAEAIKKRNVALKNKIQEIRIKKVEDLHNLKDIYRECLNNIGSSHREAAKQVSQLFDFSLNFQKYYCCNYCYYYYLTILRKLNNNQFDHVNHLFRKLRFTY